MSDAAYLDEHRGYIGTSGSGKSTTARVDVEKLLHEKRHTAIVDITGIWYGLRSDRAGTGPGFDIPIFGGRRGDVAIAAGDGRAIGKLVGDGISAIVDLSALRDGAGQRAFMADFIAAIREKPAGHFQLVCDEADEYVPEKGNLRDGAHAQVAEDMIWIAKRGRTDGYVLSLITQRLADVANAAFSQVKTIFAHQLISPSDTGAFGKYVKAHGTKAEFDLIMKGLPGLQVYLNPEDAAELGHPQSLGGLPVRTRGGGIADLLPTRHLPLRPSRPAERCDRPALPAPAPAARRRLAPSPIRSNDGKQA
jgi:DNA helicase HerA-like ATPase